MKIQILLLSLNQVIRRFRDRNEPIRLFGESDYEGYLRLKRLETDEPDAREVTNIMENTG